jgi:aspartyl-tRNA(Asn)/glutamyl-tRNA(Gln) amidotransferase subunit A
MGCATLGSDTGGSIRIPAALCGIVGLKPTYGRVSRHGAFPLAYSLDHVGPLTRSVRDAAHVLDAIAGHDLRDPASSDRPVPDLGRTLTGTVAGLRAGIFEEGLQGIDPEVRAAFDGAVETLRDAGLEIEPVSVPVARQATGALNGVIYAESAAIHQRWLAERPDEYGPDVRARLELGALLPAVHYLKAQQARSAIIAGFEQVWDDFDVLLLPTIPIEAPPIDESLDPTTRGQLTQNTRIFNVTGAPACTVPCGFTSAGLPVGLMVTGQAFDEAAVLEVSLAYELASDWKNRRPPLD